MPPMAFTGVVTKIGCMNKTATVTVSRYVIHKITGKVGILVPWTMHSLHHVFCEANRAKYQNLDAR